MLLHSKSCGWKMSIVMVAVVLCLSLSPTLVRGANGKPTPITLEECVRVALEKSPTMDSAKQTIEGAERQKKQSVTAFLPTVELNYTASRLDQAPTSSIGGIPRPVGSRDNWELETAVVQPLFTGFANLARYHLSELGLDVAKISREIDRLDLVLRVKQAYFSILESQKGLEVANQSVEALDAQLDVARNFFEVGMVPKNDVLQAEVRRAEAVQQRTVAEHNLIYAQAALNVLLRRAMDTPLEIEDILKYTPFGRTVDECLNMALDTRPEIQAARKSIEMGEQNVKVAKSGYYPTVSLVYSHSQQGDTWRVNGSDYHDASSWTLAAVASWKIFEWGRTHQGVQIQRIEVTKAKNSLTELEDGVRLQVKHSFLALEAAQKNIFTAQKAVEQADENYRMALERYKEQVATSIEVLDAETLLTSSRSSYYRALYQYNLAWAALERAVGIITF